MQVLSVAGSSLLSLVVLFLLTRMMGDKQISQMTMFDYIVGISIGSICGEMATELEQNVLHFVVAMFIYAALGLAISLATTKSIRMRNILNGKPIVLMDNGVIYRANFKKVHIDLNEFLMLLRSQGYFDLSNVQTVILEHNGLVSVLKTSDSEPVTRTDMSVNVPVSGFFRNVVMDGEMMMDSIRQSGITPEWLLQELKRQGFRTEKEVFLAVYGPDGSVSAYARNDEVPPNLDLD